MTSGYEHKVPPEDRASDQSVFAEANLLYYFWLPSGKDEFGFEAQDQAPLAGTVHYKEDKEQPIARTFRQQSRWLAVNHDSIGGMQTSGSLDPQDAELGLRKLHFFFTYQPAQAILRGIIKPGPIEGTTIILSNGLYLWSFRITYDESASEQSVKAALLRFIKEDFVSNYISRLLDFDTKVDPADLDKKYSGVLNYYQLDLLFNGLFDTEAHPYKFFDHKYVEPYSIRDVVHSASLYGFKQQYRPLWDLRGDYSQRGAMVAKKPMADTDMDLRSEHLRDAESFEQEQRELLLSRLSFSAMEQFVRVTLPFGLANYKAGLDHCRLELIGNALMLRRNQASSDFLRPSLEPNLLPSDIEAYFLLLSAKMPALVFFRDLIADMIEVTHPLHLPPENRKEWRNKRGWEEWRESKATLDEAEDQLIRQVAAIRSDLEAIQVFLAMAQSEAVMSELAEARKLNEIEVEDPRRSVTLAHRDWEQLTYWLTFVAVILAAFQAYSGIGVWVMDYLLRNDLATGRVPWWSVVITVVLWIPIVLGLYIFYRRKRKKRDKALGKADPKLDSPVRQVPNIFDCAFPRETMRGQQIEDLVFQIRGEKKLFDISTRRPELGLASVATFREAIPGGGERVKYSIESGLGERDISYTLHIEVDRQRRESSDRSEQLRNGRSEQLHNVHSEQLRNVRLVVRIPADEQLRMDDIRWIVQTYASRLIHASPQSEEARQYFSNRFGWSVT
jgi:hypothetical protein